MVTEPTQPQSTPVAQATQQGRSAGKSGAETGIKAGARANAILATALRRARLAILWERVWPAVATLASVVGLFLTVSWLGLWLVLPSFGRTIGMAVFALLSLGALIPFARIRLPARGDALHRLDRGSGLRHRPATALTDQLAVAPSDPHTAALWNAHVARTLATVKGFTVGWPLPRLAARDPYALRGLILIACVATFVAAGGERWKRVAAAFDFQGVVLPANFRVDAWVTPPTYTGRPPLILAGIHPGEPGRALTEGGAAGEPVAVPVNSVLVVRITGKTDLAVSGRGGVNALQDSAAVPAGAREFRFTIGSTGAATLHGAGEDLTWAFNVIPDRAPTIALTKDPEQQNRGSLLLSYHLEDDYGVVGAQARFERKLTGTGVPAGNAAASGNSGSADGGPHPLFGPPDFPLVLPQARTRNGVGQTIKDLTDHPWAGTEVTMTLSAGDEGGNEGKSEPFGFRLPERPFTKPLARALVEVRRNLALDARARPLVLTAIEALSLAPEKFTPEAGVYLGLRSVFWSLVRAHNDDDLRDVTTQLWSMALAIEDGDVADAQQGLRNAEEALRQALERGASDDEIKALMDQLRAAMDRLVQSMQEQFKNNQQLARPLDRNSRMLRQQDLKNMLDRLENLARSGAKDAARALLQQLEQMMENLQTASPNMEGDGDDDMMSALDDLGDMIRQQQDLRDRTYRQGQDRRRDRAQRDEDGRQSSGDLDDLKQNQQALRDRLNKLLDELKKRGLGLQQGKNQKGQNQHGQQGGGQGDADQLGHAGDAMGDAEGQLGDGDADSAVDSQGRALEALRKGAQGLAQALRQQMGEGRGPGPGQNGRLGLPRAQRDTDPLGRPLRGRDFGDDVTVKVPGEIDVQRARRIIEELRRRFGETGRPQEELDYIERLLKDY